MGDAEIFGGGVFITVWLVLFFGYSAFQLRRSYPPIAHALLVERDGAVLSSTERSARLGASSRHHDSLSMH